MINEGFIALRMGKANLTWLKTDTMNDSWTIYNRINIKL